MVMSVGVKIATIAIPCGKYVLRADSMEVSNDIKSGQYNFANL